MARATTFDFSATHSPHTNDELRAIVQALQAEAQAREALAPQQTFTLTISRQPPAAAPIGTINTAVVPIGCQIIGRRGNRKLKQRTAPDQISSSLVIHCHGRAVAAEKRGSKISEKEEKKLKIRPRSRHKLTFAEYKEEMMIVAGFKPRPDGRPRLIINLPRKTKSRSTKELDRVRLTVSKNGFDKGTTGTIVIDHGDGIGYQMEVTHPRAGLFTVLRNEIEPAF